MAAVTANIHKRYTGLNAVPGMSSGDLDSMYFRDAGAPSYSVDPTFAKPNDSFAHALSEKLLASEIPAALDFWHSLLTRLAKQVVRGEPAFAFRTRQNGFSSIRQASLSVTKGS